MVPSNGATPQLPRRTTRWIGLLIAVGYLWLFPWSEAINNPNEMVRVYSVRALVENGTYAIGTRTASGDHGPIYDQWGYVNDKALMCTDGGKPPDCHGQLYQAKAPGVTFLGVIPHAVLRLWYRIWHLGAPSKALIVWWLRLWVVLLPAIAMWAALARWLPTRLDRPHLGMAVALAGAFGSLSLTYSQTFAGHEPSGVALVALFLCTLRAGASGNPIAVVLAGFFAGWAACLEFPVGPPAGLLCLWLLARRRDPWDILRITVGAFLPIGLLLHNNWCSFGSPFSLAYGHLENAGFVQDMSPGFFGIHMLNKERVWGSLLSPFVGLYFWAPWTMVAWLGWLGVLKARREGDNWLLDRRGEAFVSLLVCLYFLYFQCSLSLWRSGWVIGPRYVTAMIPFAAIATAHAVDSMCGKFAVVGALMIAVTGAVAISVTGVTTSVVTGAPPEVYNPLAEMVTPLLLHGWNFDNPLMRLGIRTPWNALPYFVAVALAAGWMVWLSWQGVSRRRGFVIAGMAVSVLLAAVWVRGLWRIDGHRTQADRDTTVRFFMETWSPAHPPGSRPLAPELAKAHPATH